MRSLLLNASCLLLTSQIPLLATEPASPRVETRLVKALEKSVPYLEKDGRAWFEGENIYQEKGCVSCHQVPSGVWSLAHCYISLDSKSREFGDELLHDAVQFVSAPEIGRPATWAQILLAAKLANQSPETEGGLFEQARKSFLPEILNTQQEDGRWKAQGQFPSQKRPIKESDAVVTMWMLAALEGNLDDPQVQESVAKARVYLKDFQGKSNEWLAWRSITAESGAERNDFLERLLQNQNDDGSFGWAGKETGNVYSSGVALFALTSVQNGVKQSDPQQLVEASGAAIEYLLKSQHQEGYWLQSSKPITNKASESHDYIYQYWSTAWASLGLSQALMTADQ